jgi:hypothetical protein
MKTLHFYRYQLPGSKRWKMTRHRMDEQTARDWFAQFHPTAIYEPTEHGAIEIGESKEIRPIDHGGWRPKD